MWSEQELREMTEKLVEKCQFPLWSEKRQYALSQEFLALPLQTEVRAGIQTFTVGNCPFWMRGF